MSVEINITKKTYGFINPDTGQEISAEEFAKKYPGVSIGRLAVANGHQENPTISEGIKKV